MRCRLGVGLEDLPYAVLDIQEEVVDESLDVELRVGCGESTQARREHPYVEVRHSEPRLKRWREMALCCSEEKGSSPVSLKGRGEDI